MTVSTCSDVRVGFILQFSYPTDNRVKVSTRLRRRKFLVESVRDCELEPIEDWAIRLRPDLRRGRILVTGQDLECRFTRSFYLSSARSLRPLDVQLLRLATFDPFGDGSPEKFFGSIWTDSKGDIAKAAEVRDALHEWASGNALVNRNVALFPWSPTEARSHD